MKFLAVALIFGLMIIPVANAQGNETLTRPCGSNIGICEPGVRYFINGTWGDCVGEIKPTSDIDICSNDLDDNCDGQIDEGCLGAIWLVFIVIGIFLLVLGAVLYYTGYGKEEKSGFVGESLGKDIMDSNI